MNKDYIKRRLDSAKAPVSIQFSIGVLKMLKTILILALTVNTMYILPSHSSPSHGQDLAVSCAVEALGIICAWVAYKGSKKMWQTLKEVNRQIEILNEMGVKVYKVSKSEIRWGRLVTKEYYTMQTPSKLFSRTREKSKRTLELIISQ
jgi:hypothetical protein